MENISNLQKVIIIRFMKENKDFLHSKCSKVLQKKKWQMLSVILNLEKNGVKKTVDSWEKVKILNITFFIIFFKNILYLYFKCINAFYF